MDVRDYSYRYFNFLMLNKGNRFLYLNYKSMLEKLLIPSCYALQMKVTRLGMSWRVFWLPVTMPTTNGQPAVQSKGQSNSQMWSTRINTMQQTWRGRGFKEIRIKSKYDLLNTIWFCLKNPILTGGVWLPLYINLLSGDMPWLFSCAIFQTRFIEKLTQWVWLHVTFYNLISAQNSL